MTSARTLSAIRCDDCDAPAATIHLLPWCGGCRAYVRFACRDHNPGGYWFHIGRWVTGPEDWNRPGRKYTIRQYLLEKPDGGRLAVDRIEERLPKGLVAAGRRA